MSATDPLHRNAVDADHRPASPLDAGTAATCARCGAPLPPAARPDRKRTWCSQTCRIWTTEAIIKALQDFAHTHGVSPRQTDCQHRPELPSARTVCDRFGSWKAGLRAAGLIDPSTETWLAIVAAVQSGEPAATIAARHGVSTNTIYQRFATRGLRLGQFRPRPARTDRP
jgi:hypothetical protein